jgi:hypothetical protein
VRSNNLAKEEAARCIENSRKETSKSTHLISGLISALWFEACENCKPYDQIDHRADSVS